MNDTQRYNEDDLNNMRSDPHLNDTQPLDTSSINSHDSDRDHSAKDVDTAPIYAVKDPNSVNRSTASGWPDTPYRHDWVADQEKREREARKRLPWYRKLSGWAIFSVILIVVGALLYLMSNFGYLLFVDKGRGITPSPTPSASSSRPIKTQTPKPVPTMTKPPTMAPVPSQETSQSSDPGLIERGRDWLNEQLDSSPTPSRTSVPSPTVEDDPVYTTPEDSESTPDSTGGISDSLPSLNTDAIQEGWDEFKQEGGAVLDSVRDDLSQRWDQLVNN